MPSREYVVLVDEQDQEIGIEDKLIAHQQGKLHRAFSIFITRYQAGKLQILLQQRQLNKYHSAGLWSNTCCSHPRPGETILTAAQRRLREEMGIVTELKEIGAFCYKADVGAGLIEHEFDHIFMGEFSQDPIAINQQEAAAWQWVDAGWLKEDLQIHPQKYTVWLKAAYDLFLTYLKRS